MQTENLNFQATAPLSLSRELAPLGLPLRLKRGGRVYSPGDLPKGLYLIKSGLIGLTLVGHESGREHFVRFFRTGQFFGHRSLFAEDSYHGAAVALEETNLVLLPRKDVLAFLERKPIFYREIVHVLARELGKCEVLHVQILENEVLPRVAQALVYLKDLYPEHLWTRQEIANFCASTVSTVIKAMAELESLGFISQRGRVIEILDREALISLQDVVDND